MHAICEGLGSESDCYQNGFYFSFFSIRVFFHEHSQFTGQQGTGKAISAVAFHHFHALRRHPDISREVTAESSPLHVASSRTRTGTFGFRAQVSNLLAKNTIHFRVIGDVEIAWGVCSKWVNISSKY